MKMTFDNCVKLYLQRNILKKSTIKSYYSLYNKHLKKNLGYKRVSKIQSNDIGLLTQNIKNYSNNYQNKILMFIKSVLKWSKRNFNIKNKVENNIEFHKRKKRNFYKVIEPNEFAKFIKTINRFDYKIFFLTLYLSGARKGEVQGLTWNDIDFKKSIINITKQWNNKANQFTPPKTESSIRQILIPKTLLKALEELKKMNNGHVDDFVFGGHKHFSATHIDRIKNKYCDMAQINRFNHHDLRHSYASLLISLQADITIVAELLGHSDVEQTLNTYAHMLPSRQKKAIERLERKVKSDMN